MVHQRGQGQILFLIVAYFGVIVLSSFLLVTLLTISSLGEGKRDVSSDFQRGHVIGKVYELQKDVYLYQYTDSDQMTLDTSLSQRQTWKNNKFVDIDPYSIKEIIPKGNKFRVYKVLVKTHFGEEMCSQDIFAHFMDLEGMFEYRDNPQLLEKHILVSRLFNGTNGHPDENWIFEPCSEWLTEVKDADLSQ
ncbi:MAG: hypothetical protein KBA81_08480 [Rhabdochlamydiaceae bacterium]|nr:hypothetical protein [Rhabdochlamydiaceae bacterium]